MKQLEATLIVEDENEAELDEPYFKLEDGSTVKFDDVLGADWKEHDEQIDNAFAVARAGKGELICLVIGDDAIWLTTSDKIKKARAKVKR